jgi:hypothetical protein
MTSSRPWNRNTPKTQPARKKNPTQSLERQHQNGQELTSNITTQRRTDQATHPRQIPQRAHRLDRSRAPVRPVIPGQLGMKNTRVSTPPNPTPDLLIHSTDSHKTLGIVGTPHGHSIAKLWSTKTVESRGIDGFLPRTPQTLEQQKPQNRAPFLMDLGGESKGKEP